MVIVIHQASSTANAFFYNERKAKEGKATFYHSRNTPSANPFIYSAQHRHQIFKRIEDSNTRVKNKGLHISFNPTMNDMIRLGEKGIRTELDNLMKQLGYGKQPYLVYRHADIDRVHFHIVSTRIDKQSGKKIKDNFEKEKVQKFIKELEQTYQLKNDDPKEKIDLKFTAYSKNLKQSLENLFTELNRMDFITSKLMYNDALKLFHVEIRQVHKGHLVFVTDGNENPIRHPIRMSDFEERPRFYESKEKAEKIGLANDYTADKSGNTIRNYQGNSRMLVDLLRLIPNYSDKNSSRKKKQLIKNKRKGQRRL
ncbi:MAG: relaxase/mobilization nuclease domain-containing protein [Prolixibacteraceae bacterium]|nr:relaxase/mobilization nuclease domain-containing protein [Prolixibacteraceae bacterium]